MIGWLIVCLYVCFCCWNCTCTWSSKKIGHEKIIFSQKKNKRTNQKEKRERRIRREYKEKYDDERLFIM